MKDRTIGSMRVSAMGLGCMGMSEYYGSQSEEESISTLHHAVHLGVNLFDTADQYGLGANEELVGKALAPFRKELYLATKFGYVRSEKGEFIEINGRPDYVKKACDASLKRLGTDYIDLYYLHRVDPRVPIEETVGAMKELIDEGKVRFIGLSEASAETIRRAVRIHPIAALQSEYSLWSREAEEHVLPACRELGISEAIVDDIASTEEEKKEIAQIIYDESLRMGRLVNDLLDLARMESGHTGLHYETVNLHEFLEKISRKFSGVAKEKGVSLTEDISVSQPECVFDQYWILLRRLSMRSGI